MTEFPPVRKGVRDLISAIRFKDFDVSWAGASSLKDGIFCFGSEDGQLQWTDADGEPRLNLPSGSESAEAVNGVAFLPDWLSVSSRSQINFITVPKSKNELPVLVYFPVGAHGVTSGSSGYFFAPVGRKGLLFCRPKVDSAPEATISNGLSEQLYFYRLIALQIAADREIVACALRHGGVGTMEFKGQDQQHGLNTRTFNGLDVIDICRLNLNENPTAAAALGKDGTLILFRDILQDRDPVTIKHGVKGVAYRLLSTRGYLFLLTSKALYVMAGIVDHLLSGATNNPTTPFLELPMEAVDANLVGDRWILIVMPDGVLRLDVEAIASTKPVATSQDQRPTLSSPPWKSRKIPQTSTLVCAGV